MITAGMAWVRNSKKMYEAGDGHVHVLEASVRNLNHLLGAFALQAEPATAPWEEWLATSFPIVIKRFFVQGGGQALISKLCRGSEVVDGISFGIKP
jgi:hypothetical protein